MFYEAGKQAMRHYMTLHMSTGRLLVLLNDTPHESERLINQLPILTLVIK